MPDYTPAYLPGLTMTAVTSGTVTGGDPVEVSGSGTVAKVAGAASVKYVGIAGHDAASGAKLTVFLAKTVHDGIADGAVTAGDQLVASSTASKTVKSLAASNQDVGASPTQSSINTAVNTAVNQARAIIGVALTTAIDGATVRWMQK